MYNTYEVKNMELVLEIVSLIVILWLLVQINRAEISLRSIAKNLEILAQNQKVYISKQLEKDKDLKETEHIEGKDEIERINKDEILNKMRNKL